MQIKLFKNVILISMISFTFTACCSIADIQEMAAGGSAIQTSETHYAQTQAAHVKLYYRGERYKQPYKIIGRVSASNDNLMGLPHSALTIDNKLKEEAASLGANAVIDIYSNLENTVGQAVIYKK